jgi:hypothetical protein
LEVKQLFTLSLYADCGIPSLENGEALTPEGTQFGDSAIITCNEGFTVEGSVRIQWQLELISKLYNHR